MKAVVYKKSARPDKLVYSDVEKPHPSDDEILIRIHTVSPNAADYRSMKLGIVPKKKIFGSAISGHVESVGQDVRQFKAGNQVIADLTDHGFGGFAEYVAVTEKVCVHKPEGLSFEDAATLPVAAITALQALRIGEVKKGQKVLVVGSAGGVGTFAIQLAKYFEAEVTAVCSTHNIEQSRALGADHVIDYTQEDFTKSKRQYDIILAINGNYPLLGYRRCLTQQGVYVMVGGTMMQIFKSIFFGWLFSLGSRKKRQIMASSDPEDLAFVANLLADDKIKAVIDRRYPLEATAKAMDYLLQGHAKGKVVIQVVA